tara:strand:+ start:171 stop:743 length:573 start_codon:yes stop_codon:yes gene_type:complete
MVPTPDHTVRVYRKHRQIDSAANDVIQVGPTMVHTKLQRGWAEAIGIGLVFQGDGYLTKTYPPYTLRQKENDFVLEFAVAGISPDRLEVKVQDELLTILCNEATEEEDEWEYLLNTRANRKFSKEFILQDDVEVTGSELKDGLLLVYLTKNTIEPNVRSIPIKVGDEDAEKIPTVPEKPLGISGCDEETS